MTEIKNDIEYINSKNSDELGVVIATNTFKFLRYRFSLTNPLFFINLKNRCKKYITDYTITNISKN